MIMLKMTSTTLVIVLLVDYSQSSLVASTS
jgi:hypothetical protein